MPDVMYIRRHAHLIPSDSWGEFKLRHIIKVLALGTLKNQTHMRYLMCHRPTACFARRHSDETLHRPVTCSSDDAGMKVVFLLSVLSLWLNSGVLFRSKPTSATGPPVNHNLLFLDMFVLHIQGISGTFVYRREIYIFVVLKTSNDDDFSKKLVFVRRKMHMKGERELHFIRVLEDR